MHGVKQMESMSVALAEPVTRSNYTKTQVQADPKNEMFVDINGLKSAVKQYRRDLRKAGFGAKKSKKAKKKK